MKKGILLLIIAALMLLAACDEKARVISKEELLTETEEPSVSSAEPETTAEAALAAVYVCGAVQSPGVYMLTDGALVCEALDMAGGFAEDAARDYVNLAARVADGMQLYIPHADELSAQTVPVEIPGVQGADAGGKVNINTATKEELMTLPGIGESKAADIVNYREKNGSFQTPEDIKKINGIKDGVYGRISDLITVE